MIILTTEKAFSFIFLWQSGEEHRLSKPFENMIFLYKFCLYLTIWPWATDSGLNSLIFKTGITVQNCCKNTWVNMCDLLNTVSSNRCSTNSRWWRWWEEQEQQEEGREGWKAIDVIASNPLLSRGETKAQPHTQLV